MSRERVRQPSAEAMRLLVASARTQRVQLDDQIGFDVLRIPHPHRRQLWARVWSSGVVLSRWIVAQPLAELCDDALELGCGLGLVSLTYASRGLRIEATDRSREALALTAATARLNGVVGLSCGQLEWAEPTRLSRKLVFGSDLLYKAKAPGLLFRLLATGGLIEAGGRVVLTCPGIRSELMDELARMLGAEGYTQSMTSSLVDWREENEVIELHVFTRPAR